MNIRFTPQNNRAVRVNMHEPDAPITLNPLVDFNAGLRYDYEEKIKAARKEKTISEICNAHPHNEEDPHCNCPECR